MSSKVDIESSSKPKNNALRIIFDVLIGLIVLLALIFTIVGLSQKNSNKIPSLFGQGYLNVVSYSMVADEETQAYNKEMGYPCAEGFTRGDILLVKTYTSEELGNMQREGKHFEVGDVITFPAIIDGVMSYNTHRIVKVIETNGSYSYETKGDAYDEKDMAIINQASVLATYDSKVKSLGNVFLFLQMPIGFLICIVLPLVILFCFELYNFIKVFKEYKQDKLAVEGVNGQINSDSVQPEKSQEQLLQEIEELKKQLQNKENK